MFSFLCSMYLADSWGFTGGKIHELLWIPAKTGDYMGMHEGKDEWTIKKWWLYIYMILWFYQSSWGLIKGYYMSKNWHWSTIQKNVKDGNTICIDSCGLVKGSTIKDGDDEWRSSKNIIWMVIWMEIDHTHWKYRHTIWVGPKMTQLIGSLGRFTVWGRKGWMMLPPTTSMYLGDSRVLYLTI